MYRPSVLRPLLTTLALLCVAALPAHSQGGFNIAWNDCGSFGIVNRNFACNTNSGTNEIFISFLPPVTMYQLEGMELAMAVSTSTISTLSPWWHFETGGCRSGSMTAAFDYTGGPFNCADPWVGLAAGGIDYTPSFYGPNRSRIKAICAVPSGVEVDPGTEYYGMTIRINDANTVGTGSCTGCLEGACFSVLQVKIVQPAGLGDYILYPALGSMVTWHGGTPTDCVVPTRAKSWGQIKSLYR